MAFTEDLITRLRADTTDYESKIRSASSTMDDFAGKPIAFGRNWENGAQKFGRGSLQIIKGLSDVDKGGADLGQTLGRMSLNVADVAEGFGRVAGLSPLLIGGIAGVAGIAASMLPLLIDLGKQFFDVGNKAEDTGKNKIPEIKNAFLEAAAAADKARLAGQQFQHSQAVNQLAADLVGKGVPAIEAVIQAENAYRETVAFLAGDVGKTTAKVNDHARALDGAAEAARRAAEQGALSGALGLPSAGDKFAKVDLQVQGLQAEQMALAEQARMAELENLMAVNPAIEANVELMGRQAVASDLAAQAAFRNSAAMAANRAALRAMGQAATDSAATTIAMGIAQGKNAGAIIQAVRSEATVMALKEAALSLSSYAWGNVASGTLHAQSAAMWTAIAAVSGLVGGGGGGGSGGRRFAPGERGSARELAEDRRRREEEDRRGGLSLGPSSIGSERARGQPLEVNIYVPIGGRQAGAREIAAALRELGAEDGRTVNEIFTS